MFPQTDSFSYIAETKDKYGTITSGATTSHTAHIEAEYEYSDNGSVLAKGKIYTTDATVFLIDAIVTISTKNYTIISRQPFTVPNYVYQVLRYV